MRMDFDIAKLENFVRRSRRRRLMKRCLALLSAVVVLCTMNTLKRAAVAIEHIPTCGYEYEHVHTAECFDEQGALICPLHEHTDACYQETPDTGAILERQEFDLGEGDGDYTEFDESQVPMGDADAQTDGEVSDEPAFDMNGAQQAMLSQILAATGLELDRSTIQMVGLVDDAGEGNDAIAVALIDDDFSITALRDFEAVEIAIFNNDGIFTVKLLNGAAPQQTEEAPVEDIENTSDAEENVEETIEENIEENVEKNIEQPVVDADANEGDEIIKETEVEITGDASDAEEQTEVGGEAEDDESESGDAGIVEAVEDVNADAQENVEENIEENVEENVDENVDENVEENIEENIEENSEENIEENSEENVEENIEENSEENVEENIDENVEENVEENDNNNIEETETSDEEENAQDAAAVEAVEAQDSADAATDDVDDAEVNEEEAEQVEEKAEEQSEESEENKEDAEEQSEESEENKEDAEEQSEESEENKEEAQEESEENEEDAQEESEENNDEESAADTEEVSEDAEAEQESAEVDMAALYPAQSFEGVAGKVHVSVTAEAGAFHAETEMRVSRVWDSETLGGIANAVTEDFVEVKKVMAVDIAFFNAEGEEIEPLLPISVVMTVEELEENQDAVVVHMDDDGNAELVEQTDAPQTEDAQLALNVELPAAENAEELTAQILAEAAVETAAEDSVEADETVAEDTAIVADDAIEENTADIAEENADDTAVEAIPADDNAENNMEENADADDDTDGNADAAENTDASDETADGAETDDENADEEPVIEYGDEAVAPTEDAATGDGLDVEAEAAPTESIAFEADSFSVYAVVVTETIEARYIAADGQNYIISVGYGPEAEIPAGAELEVKELTGAACEAYLAKTESLLGEKEHITLARYFDITILNAEGAEVQPAAPVRVEVKLADDPDDAVQAVHFADAGAAERIDVSRDDEVMTFSARSFSVYGIVYTVDFYYDVDGKTFEHHITGGDVIGLKALLPILKVVEADEAQAFVENIESVTFTDESLVKVVRVAEDTTAGDIVDALDEEIEYSAELTDEDIEAIRARELVAPDWALVSLKPFFTEEALTITLKNGEVVTVKVTDVAGSGYVNVDDYQHGYLKISKDQPYNDIGILYGGNLNNKNGDSQTNVRDINALARADYIFEKWTLRRVNQWWDEDYSYNNVIPSGTITLQNIYNGDVYTAHFIAAQRGIDIEEGSKEQGKFKVGDTEYTNYVFYQSWWKDGNGKNAIAFEAVPNTGYSFDHWNYYRSNNNNGSGYTCTQTFSDRIISAGTFDMDRNESWFLKAVFKRTSFTISVNNTSAGDVVDEYGASCLGMMQPTLDGKLPKTIKAVPNNGNYAFGCWKLDNVILPIVSDTIHPDDYPDIDFGSASELQAVFAKVIDANGNAQQNVHISDDKAKEFQAWMESLKNKEDVTVDKTAHVVDYQNRIYEVDISANSAKIDFGAEIDLAFILDMSSSMLFPYHLVRMDHAPVLLTQETLNELFPDHNSDHFFISSPTLSSTVYRLFVNTDGKWYAVDEAWWQKDGGDKSGSTVQEKKFPVGMASRYSDPEGGPYAYPLYTIGNATHRQQYLNNCLSETIQSMKAILNSVRKNGGSAAEINVANLNFCYEVKAFENFRKLSEHQNLQVAVTNTEGGTRQDLALARAQGFTWKAGHQKYAILITDGAPVISSGVTDITLDQIYDNITTNAKTLKDNGVTLITVGLSTKNVTRGSQKLYEIASPNPNNPSQKLFFEAEEDGDLQNILYEIVETIVKHARIGGQITDTVDAAFYPVDDSGNPISAGHYDMNGNSLSTEAWQQKMNAREPIYEWTVNNGVWTITWYNQHIGWDVNNQNNNNKPWEQSFHIKAKEDFLGGNQISTNANGSVTPEAYLPDGSSTWVYAPKPAIALPVPHVNVDELRLTENSSEWTVYLGTKVDPLEQLKALYGKIDVQEVVTRTTDGAHVTMTSAADTVFPIMESEADGREKKTGAVSETFPLSAVAPLKDADWQSLIAGETVTVPYSKYGHNQVGNIIYTLTKEVVSGEDDLTEEAHATEVVGQAVEKYTLKAQYVPVGETDPADGWHTTPGHSRGKVADTDTMISTNNHVINVFAHKLAIRKIDSTNQNALSGAKFELIEVNEGTTPSLKEKNYTTLQELTVGQDGTVVSDYIRRPAAGKRLYLIETEAPEGYIALASAVPVNLSIEDWYRPVPNPTNAAFSQTKPAMPYDWQEEALLSLEASGTSVARTDEHWQALNTAPNKEHVSAVLYYQISNTPGVRLPNTGGAGTGAYTAGGAALVLLAVALLLMKRRHA